MKKKLSTTCIFFTLLFIAQPAFAVDLWCTGTINRMYVDRFSRVYVQPSWHSDYTMLCDLDTEWKDVDADACQGWFEMLRGAHESQSTVTVYYPGVSEASCSDFPTYNLAPGPYYAMIREEQ